MARLLSAYRVPVTCCACMRLEFPMTFLVLTKLGLRHKAFVHALVTINRKLANRIVTYSRLHCVMTHFYSTAFSFSLENLIASSCFA